MKTLSLKEIQNRDLKLLIYFDTFAKEHNLTYYLSGGTLLGAVRHQGFIPWDDDVDIMMPREDYERLIAEFRETEQYKLLSYETDPEYENHYIRITDKRTIREWHLFETKKTGLFLDIFPMDGFPSSSLLSLLHTLLIRYYFELWNTVMKPGVDCDLHFQKLRKIIKPLLKHTPRYYGLKINCIAKKYDYNRCSYAGVAIITHYMFRERNKRSIYEKKQYLQFEGHMFPVPGNYDVYLHNLYGDYMKLPPEENRKPHHPRIYEYEDV